MIETKPLSVELVIFSERVFFSDLFLLNLILINSCLSRYSAIELITPSLTPSLPIVIMGFI